MNPLFTPILAYWGLTTTTWLVMWGALGAATIVLVLLVRKRWSDRPTMFKCACLSLWVHLLFAVFSMTLRVVTGAPQGGEGPPIRVTVVSDPPAEVAATITEEKIQPFWEQLEAPSLVQPSSDPLPAESVANSEPGADAPMLEKLAESLTAELPSPAPPLEAPSLLPTPTPSETSANFADNSTDEGKQEVEHTPHNPEAANPEDLAAEPLNEMLAGPSTHEMPDVLPSVAGPVKSHGQIPDKYVDRFAEDLTALATERGGSEQTERSVHAALEWLAATQSSNGGWDASRFGAGKELVVLGHDRRGAGAEADTGVTGLALLAFLGSGHSHLQGSYRNEVARALEYLRQRQRSDGSLFGDAELFARMYCHAMATLAVCEAYAVTRDTRLDGMARRATSFSLAMQHPTDGGWRYRRGDTGDTSLLGWQLMALKSAELAGIEIPQITWTRVERFLERVQRGDAGGLAAYRPDSPPSRTMTAEAWFCRQLLQTSRNVALAEPAIEEALESLGKELPSASHRNLYYWYYATLALQQNQEHSPQSLEAWESWNLALTTALLSTQEADGSWNENTVWGGDGGRVYTTAISTLCLEVYYRYRPASEPGDLAGRKEWQSLR